jgi:hypothetical protein
MISSGKGGHQRDSVAVSGLEHEPEIYAHSLEKIELQKMLSDINESP